jgi:hypothetical protein
MRNLPFEDLAFDMLSLAKINLARDKHLTPVVIVAGADIRIYGMVCGTKEEMYNMYQSLWANVLPTNPKVIIQLNDSIVRGTGVAVLLELASEAISMVIYPRGDHAWSASLPYIRKGKDYIFKEISINANEDGNTLGSDLGPQPWFKNKKCYAISEDII